MAHLRMLTPETSPEPELRPSGLWQSKPAITTTTNDTQLIQKRKRSWPFTTTRPASPPSCSCPSGGDRPSSSNTTSVKALWESGWRAAARKGAAPFQDARYEDLQPIFDALIEAGTDDADSPEYTLAFYPRAHELALLAENALLHHGDAALAAELYLRACAVLRAARYSPPPNASSSSLPTPVEAETSSPPHPACPVRARAWQLQKSYHLRAGRLFPDSPLDEVTIPHTHDAATRPDQNSGGVRDKASSAAAARATTGPARPQIPLAVRLPPRTLRTGAPCPAVLVVSGDRTAHSALCADLLARGWGCVVVEAPGCGDCPVSLPSSSSSSSSSSKEDDSAAAASALWASVLEWMGAIRVFDMARVVVWADSGVDRPSALAGQFAAAVGGARIRGCVAVVGGGSSAVLASPGGDAAWGSGGGRVLVVAENSGGDKAGTCGACDGCRGGGDGRDGGLVLFEYGAAGMGAGAEAAVRTLAAGAAAVYDWVEDLLGLDVVV